VGRSSMAVARGGIRLGSPLTFGGAGGCGQRGTSSFSMGRLGSFGGLKRTARQPAAGSRGRDRGLRVKAGTKKRFGKRRVGRMRMGVFRGLGLFLGIA